jgi:hypothetical protein
VAPLLSVAVADTKETAFPVVRDVVVTSLGQKTLGACASLTVTTKEHVAALPAASFAV